MNSMKIILFILLLFIQFVSLGQGYGARTFSLAPKNLTSFSLYYVNLNSNVTPSEDVVLANGTVDVNALAIPIVHTFSIAGHLSEVFITPGFGRIGGIIDVDNHQSEIVDVNGLLDANVMMRVGILNTPSLDLENFIKHELKFQLSVLVGITIPIGQYDQTRHVNLGGNRWAFKFGIPFILPLNKNKKRLFQWDFVPSVTFYAHNTKPFIGDVKTQKPLFRFEQHLSKNFTDRFWVSVNMGYQYGGKTSVDGSSSGNVINQIGAGATLAYSPFSSIPITFQGSYSRIWFSSKSGHLFEFGVSMSIPSKSDRLKIKAMDKK